MMRKNRRRAQPRSGMALLVAVLLAAITLTTGLAAEPVLRLGWTAPSASGLPDGWQPLIFKNIPRYTRYTAIPEDDGYVMKAEADRSASGLIRRVTVAPAQYPILRWRWKVENVLRNGDLTRKKGDDYPARIYVTFAYDPQRAGFWQRIEYESTRLLFGEYPPHAGLNYIWESRAPVGTGSAPPGRGSGSLRPSRAGSPARVSAPRRHC